MLCSSRLLGRTEPESGSTGGSRIKSKIRSLRWPFLLPIREVGMKVINNDYSKKIDYFGAVLTIPENHRYIATDADGAIYSYYSAPDFDGYSWNTDSGFCRVGTAELRSEEAEKSFLSLS